YRSFFSGHTSTSFAVAGLTCMHHAHFRLYESFAGDAIACVTAFSVATATGYLRMAAAKHYFTDVLTGAAWGSLLGLGMLWLLDSRSGLSVPITQGKVGWVRVFPSPLGATMMGAF